eukprot:jgi/Undpi1/320/HiC_scaffold_1.g00316.m1
MSAAGSASQGTKRKNFNVLEREEVIRHLLANSKDGVLRHGSYQEAAVKYGCGWETIKGVWAKHEQREAAGDPSAYIGNNRKGKSGRKGIDLEDLRTRLRDIPLNGRTTRRRLAAALGIPQPTLYHNLKKLGLKAHSSALKPYLTPEGKKERLRWVLRWLRTDGQRFYLYDGEEPPVRKVQSKRFITKIMFLAAVARPRHNPATNSLFDGKIGLWAFTEKVRAARNSRNRAAGTMVTKCVEVTRETYKEKLINGVIPAIKEKWPAATRRNTIYVQQDNAKPHRVNDDEDLLEACSSDGLHIQLINQPPNSPDTNILDLGFFASIKSLQDRTRARTVDDLFREVETAWAAADPAKLGKTLLYEGDNTYKLPHLKKDTAARAGTTIGRRYPVSDEAWLKGTAALAALEGQGDAAGGRGAAAGGRGAAAGGRGAAAGRRGAAAGGRGAAAGGRGATAGGRGAAAGGRGAASGGRGGRRGAASGRGGAAAV